MAITLDELLGRNTVKNSAESVENFPSYDEFKVSRNTSQPAQSYREEPRYNFDMRPAAAPRSEESVRSYEAQRPYVAPRVNEYQTRDYAFYDTLQRRAQVREPEYTQYEDTSKHGYSQYEAFAKPQYRTQERTQSLYEFTAVDNDRLSDDELFDKLSHTNASRRPIFDRQTSSASKAATGKVSEAKAMQSDKKRARLNTKGKVILAVYLAVIILVAVLIIINAGDINRGSAPTPTSSVVNASAYNNVAEYDFNSSNIFEDMQINSLYEIGF